MGLCVSYALDVATMIDALAKADVVLGSRFLGRTQGATRRRRALLRVSVVVSNWLSGARFTDAHCGLRAFRASAAPSLRITQDGMAHASELLKKIVTSSLRVIEVPITVRYTEYSMAKGQSGLQAVRILFDYLVRR
jgi:polyprenyl-phospho-N-acetylgalactosaminyl synthase